MLAAGLLAKKAVQAGLTVQPHIKTSLAPARASSPNTSARPGCCPTWSSWAFLSAYGCTTCIGNAGDLAPELNEAITRNNLVRGGAVGQPQLRGAHPPQPEGQLPDEPPLVVAYAIAGNVMADLMTQPVGQGKAARTYLGDIWPRGDEINRLLKYAMKGKAFRDNYAKVGSEPGKLWERVEGVSGEVYNWPTSTYIAEPPFFNQFTIDSVAGGAGLRAYQQAI